MAPHLAECKEEFIVQGNKEEITKVVSLCSNGRKNVEVRPHTSEHVVLVLTIYLFIHTFCFYAYSYG